MGAVVRLDFSALDQDGLPAPPPKMRSRQRKLARSLQVSRIRRFSRAE